MSKATKKWLTLAGVLSIAVAVVGILLVATSQTACKAANSPGNASTAKTDANHGSKAIDLTTGQTFEFERLGYKTSYGQEGYRVSCEYNRKTGELILGEGATGGLHDLRVFLAKTGETPKERRLCGGTLLRIPIDEPGKRTLVVKTEDRAGLPSKTILQTEIIL